MKPELTDPKKGYEYFKDRVSFSAGPMEVYHWIEDKEKVNIVDVRREEDYVKGHVPGAISLPKEKWSTFKGLSKDKVNIVYCYTQQCHLAPTAALEFTKNGYSCIEMEGGFDVWSQWHLPVQALTAAAR